MKIIGIAGLPGSGKTEALEIFKSKGIPVFNMGDVVTKIEAKKRGVKKLNETTEHEIRTDLRKKYGEDAIAIMTSQEIEKTKSNVAAIAGIHSFSEINYFKKRFGSVVIIAIEASKETRLKRLSKRKIRSLTKEEFEQREAHDRYDIPEIMKKADYKVSNDGAMKEFKKSLEKAIDVVIQ